MSLTAVLAADRAGTIGRDGALPWPRIPADLTHFKTLTEGGHVIMGRKTFQALPGGRPLRGRHNIVLSHGSGDWAQHRNVTVAHSTGEALAATGYSDAFIVGGAQVYSAFLPLTTVIYLTVVAGEYEGDAAVDFRELLDGFTPDHTMITCPAMGTAPSCQIIRFTRTDHEAP